MSRAFMLDLLDAADEQRWVCKTKGKGVVFLPPRDKARPGFEMIFVEDPKHDTHSEKCIRDKLRKAGLKLPGEQEHLPMQTTPQRSNGHVPHEPKRVESTQPAPRQPENLFAQLRGRVNECMNGLAEIERLISAIELDATEMHRLRDLLRSTLGAGA